MICPGDPVTYWERAIFFLYDSERWGHRMWVSVGSSMLVIGCQLQSGTLNGQDRWELLCLSPAGIGWIDDNLVRRL